MTIAASIAPNRPAAPSPKRWTVAEYEDWVERGGFRGQHVFLFRGEIIQMPPMGAGHAFTVMKATSVLSQLFPSPKYYVRVQLPFAVPGDSLPEPDLAVCLASDVSESSHPSRAVLLVEVADSSLSLDREKALEYAAANVPEYWIINLVDHCVEVYRDPVRDGSAELGFRYRKRSKERKTLLPLALDGADLPVAMLLSGT